MEVRSLNHRYLDIIIKSPNSLNRFDHKLRELIKELFQRGRVEVFITSSGAEKILVKVNTEAAAEVARALKTLKEELSLSGEIGLDSFLGYKDLFMSEDVQYDEAPLFEALGEALLEVREMRDQEGEAMAHDVASRASRVRELKDIVVAAAPEALEAARARFVERAKAFLPSEAMPDETRLIQEAASAAERADIAEEITRIGSHLDFLSSTLKEGGKIGRKLDFILQELNRESNTIASKAEDRRILEAVLEMKAEIESMREMVQNIQ